MADRTCTRCGKVFKFPSRLARHLERKTPCDPVAGEEPKPPKPNSTGSGVAKWSCEFCARPFTSSQAMYRHRKHSCRIAKGGPAVWKDLRQQLRTARDKALEAKAEEMKEMRKRLTKLEQKMEGGGGGGAAPTVVNNTINNIQQTTFNFNAFGNEDVSHMREFTRAVLSSGRSADEVLELLGKQRWADPEHPENGTMYLLNVKDTRVRTLRADGQWETRDRDIVHRQAHTALTNQAYNNQPRTEKGSLAADPILKKMDAIDKGRAPFPTGVYNSITESGRVHKHTRE